MLLISVSPTQRGFPVSQDILSNMNTSEEYHSMIVSWRYPTENRHVIGYYNRNRQDGYLEVTGWTHLLHMAEKLGHFAITHFGTTEEESRLVWESLGENREGVSLRVLLSYSEIETMSSVRSLIQNAAYIVSSILTTASEMQEKEIRKIEHSLKHLESALQSWDPFIYIHYLAAPETIIASLAKPHQMFSSDMQNAANMIAEARKISLTLGQDTGRIAAGIYDTR